MVITRIIMMLKSVLLGSHLGVLFWAPGDALPKFLLATCNQK